MRKGIVRSDRVIEAEILYRRLNAWTDGACEDEADTLLARFAEVTDDTAALYHFLAYHSFKQNNMTDALALLKEAYKGRKVSDRIWRLFERLYRALGDDVNASFWAGLLTGFSSRWKPSSQIVTEAGMPMYILGCSHGDELPVVLQPNGDAFSFRALVGESLRTLEKTDAPYWAGVYNRYRTYGQTAKELLQTERHAISDYRGVYFDLCRHVAEAKEIELRADKDMIVPIAVADTKGAQAINVEITDGTTSGDLILGRMEWKYIRVDAKESLRLRCASPMAVGRSVPLRHSPKRKKLILNLMLDGVSWKIMQETNYRHVPHVKRFFSKGIIFDEAYCVAEYTYPSFPTVETGLYPHRSQVVIEHRPVYADESEPLSVKARDAGYYTVTTMCNLDGVGTGTLRGMERIIGTSLDSQSACMAVARTIEQIEAFSETDQYIFAHIEDAHSKANIAMPMTPAAETNLSWEENLYAGDAVIVSMPKIPLYVRDNLLEIEQLDRHLGILFDYIEEHYEEDEYIVHAYSDHGMSVHRKTDWFFDDGQAKVAMMMRGAGIPNIGHTDELVSLMDMYAVISKGLDAPIGDADANLPAAFGGKEREYVVSNSIFPGQTYKLGIRTKDYEYRLETADFTRPDGTLNMSDFTEHAYDRATGEECFDPAVLDYFLGLALEHTKTFAHDTD
ncbi:sulfatase-like hydrolase/transferase [Selenomonas sp. TAMA-11512]|uniref:sulfatase-like hydrolase/transferase n=1 Tax=Selenomonas sp. TAMA-11512 TaxID=3095337 RepID=UPI0030CD5B4A